MCSSLPYSCDKKEGILKLYYFGLILLLKNDTFYYEDAGLHLPPEEPNEATVN